MKILFTPVLTCMALCAMAQPARSVFHFKTAFSLNPMVLAATDNTLMLGAEHQLQHRLALVLDAGYIFATYYFPEDVQRGIRGFTVRPGLKWYNQSAKGFFQLQAAYKQVDYKLEDWLGKACVAGVPAYEQFQEFTFRKKTLSFNVLAGELFRLSDAVLLELYGGLGAKIKDQQPLERTACYRNEEGGTMFDEFREHYNTVTVPLGIKILVAIR